MSLAPGPVAPGVRATGQGRSACSSRARFSPARSLAIVSSNIRRVITFFEAEAHWSEAHIVGARRRKNQRCEALACNEELLTKPTAAP